MSFGALHGIEDDEQFANAGGSAAAVLLIVKAPRGDGDIVNVLFGNIPTVPEPLLSTTAIAFAMVLGIQFLIYNEFLITAYDPDVARALAIRITLWNTIFYVTLGIAVAITIRAVGALLTFIFERCGGARIFHPVVRPAWRTSTDFRKFLPILLVEPLALFAVTDHDPGGASCDVIQDPQDLVLGRAAVFLGATAIEQDCAMRFAGWDDVIDAV